MHIVQGIQAGGGPARRVMGASTALVLMVAAGCVAPFSEMQSARTVGPGNTEITPSYSHVRFSEGDENEKLQDDFGIQVAMGVNEQLDIRARYEMIRLSDADDSETFHTLGAGPKIALVEDRAAFYAPVGLGFGGGIEVSESVQIQPTLLFTIPVSRQIEINPSAKAQIWLNNDADNLLAFNLGLGLGPDLARWAIRPEVGLLINPGEDGQVWHFSIGVSRVFTGGD